MGGTGGTCPPKSQKSAKIVKEKCTIKLVGYTLRLKNYVKIPPTPNFCRIFRAGTATAKLSCHLLSTVAKRKNSREDSSWLWKECGHLT